MRAKVAFSLTDLPDDILCCIKRKTDYASLISLHKTCRALQSMTAHEIECLSRPIYLSPRFSMFLSMEDTEWYVRDEMADRPQKMSTFASDMVVHGRFSMSFDENTTIRVIRATSKSRFVLSTSAAILRRKLSKRTHCMFRACFDHS